MDLRIVTDSATRLVVQTAPDQFDLWVMASVVCGVIAVAAAWMWRRARVLAICAFVVSGGLYLLTASSLLLTGGIVDEFSLDRNTNQFVTDSFYTRDHRVSEAPVVRPLSSVLRADVEQTRNGAILIVTLTSGDRVYPLGHASRTLSNEFLVVDRIQHLLGRPAR